MKIVSFSHTVCSTAGAAHFKETLTPAAAGDPSSFVDYPPGSVLELDDNEALSLTSRGLVVEWNPDEHGATPRDVLGRMLGQGAASAKQSSEVRRA